MAVTAASIQAHTAILLASTVPETTTKTTTTAVTTSRATVLSGAANSTAAAAALQHYENILLGIRGFLIVPKYSGDTTPQKVLAAALAAVVGT